MGYARRARALRRIIKTHCAITAGKTPPRGRGGSGRTGRGKTGRAGGCRSAPLPRQGPEKLSTATFPRDQPGPPSLPPFPEGSSGRSPRGCAAAPSNSPAHAQCSRTIPPFQPVRLWHPGSPLFPVALRKSAPVSFGMGPALDTERSRAEPTPPRALRRWQRHRSPASRALREAHVGGARPMGAPLGGGRGEPSGGAGCEERREGEREKGREGGKDGRKEEGREGRKGERRAGGVFAIPSAAAEPQPLGTGGGTRCPARFPAAAPSTEAGGGGRVPLLRSREKVRTGAHLPGARRGPPAPPGACGVPPPCP